MGLRHGCPTPASSSSSLFRRHWNTESVVLIDSQVKGTQYDINQPRKSGIQSMVVVVLHHSFFRLLFPRKSLLSLTSCVENNRNGCYKRIERNSLTRMTETTGNQARDSINQVMVGMIKNAEEVVQCYYSSTSLSIYSRVLPASYFLFIEDPLSNSLHHHLSFLF
jgi:hypothetical protein